MPQRFFNTNTMRWEVMQGGLGGQPGIGIARDHDIMSRLPDAEIAGAIGPGVVPRGTAESAGRPLPTDETIRPLSGQDENNRGFAVILPPPDALIGETGVRTLLQMRSRGLDAELLNVVLGIDLADFDNSNEDVFGPIIPYVRCSLDWGIGGAHFSAVCDWMQGTQLSIPANYISVGAIYVKQQNAFSPTPFEPPRFRCAAGLAYGNAGRIASTARYTELVQLQSIGSTAVVQIPKYALSATILPVNNSVVGVTVRAGGSGSGFDMDYVIETPLSNAGQRNVENSIPLFNGARFLQIRNNNADPNNLGQVFIVYTLAL